MDKIIIVGFFVFIIIAIVFYYKNRAKMFASGQMIHRNKDFVEYAEIFTLIPISDRQLMDALNQIDKKEMKRITGVNYSGNAKQIIFQGLYNAKMTQQEQTTEHSVYRFEFTRYQSNHGTPRYTDGMNALLTMVEKVFLGLDPNTQVSNVKVDFKTKRNWL